MSYPLSSNKNIFPFTLIRSYVLGPSLISSSYGIRWFMKFVDACTSMTWFYLMKNKTEVFTIFQSFHKEIETYFLAKIQSLRSDNGREYVNHDIKVTSRRMTFYIR